MAKRLQRLLSLLLLSLSALQPLQAAETTLFRMHGSNTIGAELGPELVRTWLQHKGYSNVRYESSATEEGYVRARGPEGEDVRVEIRAHGSSTGFRALDTGRADIGMASRPIKPAEIKKLARLGAMHSHRSEFVLGLDGIAVVVHRNNSVRRLTKEQLHRLFAGQITDWGEVGGHPGPVRVYARDDNSGTYDTFKHLVLGKKTPLVDGAWRFESNANLSDAVAEDPSGIGFVGLPYVRKAKAVAVSDGQSGAIVPESFSVATEDYALTRRLFLYVPERNDNPLAREFAEFAASAAGQTVVGKVGFVSQEIVAGKVRLPDDAPAEYRKLTRGAQRLSLNFRFRAGSIELDNKALRDVKRLVAYMKKEENGDRGVMLFGFADRHEQLPIHSIELSIHRADQVADLLVSRGLSPVTVRGYGSAVPVASNENPAGRFKNRRVEVWVR